jgi:hypothetical protein
MNAHSLERRPGQITFRRKMILLLAVLLTAYVATYSLLSVRGRYEPHAVGVFGIEAYWWAPVGFYNINHRPKEKNLGWNASMCYAFLPLWWLDNTYIHNNQSESVNQ